MFNNRQRIIILCGTLLIILSGLYAPFQITLRYGAVPAGYGFIFCPPTPDKLYANRDWDYPVLGGDNGLEVDLSRLIIQMFVIALATALAVFLTSKNKGSTST